MKEFPIKRTIGCIVMCFSDAASALVIGSPKGNVYLGEPLNLQVEVQLGTSDDPQSLCMDAVVSYGDAEKSSGRVDLSSIHPVAGEKFYLPLHVKDLIDEPIVTVTVSNKCSRSGSAISRKFTLLADPPSNRVAPPIVPVNPTVVAETPIPPSALAAGSKPRSPAKPAEKITFAQKKAPPQTDKGSRLTVSPLDWDVEIAPLLKSSDTIQIPAVEDLAKRQAAAAMWRAINASPEEVQANEAALEQSKDRTATLSAEAASKERTLIAALATAQAEKYSNPLVYALTGLWVLTLVGGVWLWRRRAKQANAATLSWWDTSSSEAVAVSTENDDATDAGASSGLIHAQLSQEEPEHAAPVKVDFSTHEHGLQTMQIPAYKAVSEVQNKIHADLQTTEIADLRQQAEFFVVLGEHDEAIEILEQQLREHPESSPSIYLDLLEIFHILGRKKSYDAYKTIFQSYYAAALPAFESWAQPSTGLEKESSLVSTLLALWPSHQAIDYIENLLVWEPGLGKSRIPLQAYRDLIFLHELLGNLLGVTPESPQAKTTSFGGIDFVLE